MTDLEERIWEAVNRWCDQQYHEIPDQNRRYLMDEIKALAIGNVSPSLRYFYAGQALQAEIIAWNSEMTPRHRGALLQDMIDRYGESTVNEALAKTAFDMADVMLKERSNEG